MSNVLWDFVEGIGVNPYPPNQAPPIIFTQIAIPETVELPCEKPDIEHVLSVMVDAQICSVRFVDTPTATSYEGQRLLGKKAIIELKLKQKVKYVADEPTQSVHAAHFEKVLSSIFIVVPPFVGPGVPIEEWYRRNKVVITPYIEDIFAAKLDCRKVFKNITVLIDVKVLP